MRTPEWWNHNGFLAHALSPLACAYAGASALHKKWTAAQSLNIPIICIGNVTVGGAGKTPAALLTGSILKRHNRAAFFLSRGYGGSEGGPLRIDPASDYRKTGDEPLLLARELPTVIARDRVRGADLALSQGADALILDDGLQNPSLRYDLRIIVVDARIGFGNGRLLPAGPLREYPESALTRAHAVLVLHGGADIVSRIAPATPVFTGKLTPGADAPHLAGTRAVAFCGIAHPFKFRETLQEIGCEPVAFLPYGDHHPYNESDERELRRLAANLNARLVTTAKDAVRLSPDLRQEVTILHVTLTLDDMEGYERLILEAVQRHDTQ